MPLWKGSLLLSPSVPLSPMALLPFKGAFPFSTTQPPEWKKGEPFPAARAAPFYLPVDSRVTVPCAQSCGEQSGGAVTQVLWYRDLHKGTVCPVQRGHI